MTVGEYMCEGVRECEHVISGVQMSATVPVCGMCMSEGVCVDSKCGCKYVSIYYAGVRVCMNLRIHTGKGNRLLKKMPTSAKGKFMFPHSPTLTAELR